MIVISEDIYFDNVVGDAFGMEVVDRRDERFEVEIDIEQSVFRYLV
jgi:hypothetical protein